MHRVRSRRRSSQDRKQCNTSSRTHHLRNACQLNDIEDNKTRTDDPKFTTWELEVHAGEPADASALNLEDVILSFESILLAAERESQVRESRDFFAFHCVLSCPSASSSNPGQNVSLRLCIDHDESLQSVDHLRNVSGSNDKRSASVNGSTSVVEFEDIITKLEGLEFDFPIRLAADGSVLELATESSLVNSAEDNLAGILLGASDAE